jgi:MoaE-MoaD fusion protein
VIHVRISTEPLARDLADLVRTPAAGALVTFEGTTREVAHLDYEAYTEMAEPLMRTILEECLSRHELKRIAAEHRIGRVPLGEPAVIVSASAAHREQAFAGAREAIDRIKAQAPIWKREAHADGSAWAIGTPP